LKLLQEAAMTQVELERVAGGEAAVYSAPKPEADRINEDAAAVLAVDEQCAVLIVADGAGGLRAGARASALAVQAVIDSVRGNPKNGESLREPILNGFERANEAIIALGVGAGTTLAVVEINGQTYRPYHVGDSTILVTGLRGKVKLLTMSHSPVGYAIEAGMLEIHEALQHDELHLVSNLVGSVNMRIEVGPTTPLAAKDTVVLGSDGVFDNLLTEEVVEGVRRGPLREAAEKLAARCQLRMNSPEDGAPSKPDDHTFLLYRPTSHT
jgi:serine/threonine protein phosphatase PrpC